MTINKYNELLKDNLSFIVIEVNGKHLLNNDIPPFLKNVLEICRYYIEKKHLDCIKLPDGRRISSTSMTNFEFTTKVKEVQFYQKDLYNIYVRLVRRDGYDQEEEQKVIKSVRERLPDDVNVHIEYVESVERTKTGKIRYILSDIK